MADKALRGINFPGLEGTYFVPIVDAELKTPGAAADAAVTGAALSKIGDLSSLSTTSTESLVSAINELVATAGENPDWNQNDPTAPDYIKNRTHYEEVTEYLKTVTLTNQFNSMGDDVVAEIYEQRASAKYNSASGELHYIGNEGTHPTSGYPCYYISDGTKTVRICMNGSGMYSWDITNDAACNVSITYKHRKAEVHTLDPKYLPPEVAARKPLLLDADSAENYLNDPAHGDEALEAIKSGRKILVRVPNADGGSYTAIYSPIMMYQVPNYQNKYLYLFFLRDEKQDLSALLGQPDGTVQMPTYGQLKMLLSQEYNSDPLVNS